MNVLERKKKGAKTGSLNSWNGWGWGDINKDKNKRRWQAKGRHMK